jgi:hypothetical protein
MPRVGFESTIPVFERAKTVHAFECEATVIGLTHLIARKIHISSLIYDVSYEYNMLFL